MIINFMLIWIISNLHCFLLSLFHFNLKIFNEYDYSPYNCFKHTMEKEKGRYVIKHLGGKLPIVYALAAEKP